MHAGYVNALAPLISGSSIPIATYFVLIPLFSILNSNAIQRASVVLIFIFVQDRAQDEAQDRAPCQENGRRAPTDDESRESTLA